MYRVSVYRLSVSDAIMQAQERGKKHRKQWGKSGSAARPVALRDHIRRGTGRRITAAAQAEHGHGHGERETVQDGTAGAIERSRVENSAQSPLNDVFHIVKR